MRMWQCYHPPRHGSPPRSSGRFRFALRLAFFAVFAQLALGYVSAGHQARMLGADPEGWAEICTPYGLQAVQLPDGVDQPLDQDSPRLNGGMQCVVCAMAAVGAPPAAGLSFVAADEYVARSPLPVSTSAPIAHPFAVLPPSRAPPVLS
jgi:hypothetical protein